MDSERISFESFLKRKLAWQLVEADKNLSLTPEQKREVKEKIKKAENEVKEHLRNLYRIVFLPSKEKLAPLSLREKYLRDRDYVETKNILESFFKTPGEFRIVSDEVLRNCIKEGVKQGLFGLGDIEDGKPMCRHFKAESSSELTEGEILIKADLCKIPEERYKPVEDVLTGKKEFKDKEEVKKEEYGKKYHTIHLKLGVPTGKLSDIVRVIPYIKSKFNKVDVKVEISAVNGGMSVFDYEDKIMETIKQAEVKIEEEGLDE